MADPSNYGRGEEDDEEEEETNDAVCFICHMSALTATLC